ncbi:MAG TPA: alpha-galactosidase, partial [Sphingobacterium sp.]|nr:alpha-galactosidase [Sphingobacterium sp.]
MERRIWFLFLLLSVTFGSTAQSVPFRWNTDTLIIDDKVSQQHFLLEQGGLRPLFAISKNKENEIKEIYPNSDPIVWIPDKDFISAHIEQQYIPATQRTSAFHKLNIRAAFAIGEITYSITVYDDCPGTEWQFAVKGEVVNRFIGQAEHESKPIEDISLLSTALAHYFYLPLASPHRTIRITNFRDATDHNNNLIQLTETLPYTKEQFFSGNVLVARDPIQHTTNLVVKLAPIGHAQAGYSGYDFSTQFKGIKTFSPGFDTFSHTEPDNDHWHHSYPLYVLRLADSEDDALFHYKRYELAVHNYLPEYDNTFTMNTWGNRNRDSRINEAFILNELDAAHELGITHYQIDDGWQQGLSQNSSQQAGVLWDDWSAEDWKINKVRFPNGLDKVRQKAQDNNIVLGLWFNPSKNDNYRNWKRDKDILVNLYHKHQIKWIKIDGVQIGNKVAEDNVHNMLHVASSEAAGKLQFNMDVTAGKRGGYFFMNRLGNIFLENRYTDWANFYPHLTLRNVWQLARYTPVQRIQVEWLDKWRNSNKYPKGDPLKPSEIPFDYQFAMTMMAQPLAWMEATALPREAFSVRPLIDAWKRERTEMQRGIVHPIGEMPNGFGFTGFVSVTKNRIYVLVFREYAKEHSYTFDLPPHIGEIGRFHSL